MTLLPRIVLLFMMVVFSTTIIAQKSSDTYDPLYGFDPLLYNGRMYYFYPQPGTGGNQYLHDEFDTKGSVTLRGITYTNQTINFDIYNQQLVLKYKDAIGSTKVIEVSYAWLESFILKGSRFEVYTDANSAKRIYQVIGTGDKKIMYFNQKDLLLHSQTITGLYYFSKIRKETYVLNGDLIVKFKNNNGFVSAFNPSDQIAVKKYLRKQNINVKKANDIILTELINYCKTLDGQ